MDPNEEPRKVAPLTPEEIRILRKIIRKQQELSQQNSTEGGLPPDGDDWKRDE